MGAQATAAAVWAALANLLCTLAIAWYCFIWAFCLFGLHRARVMFLHPNSIPEGSTGAHGQQHGDGNQHRNSSPPSTSPSSSPSSSSSLHLPGVSILRPLAGEDANLFANLASTFRQDYPDEKYEIIFSVGSPNDAALPVARKVVERYRQRRRGVKAQIIVGDVWSGVNPKINNLLRPYCRAQNDILWIVDSQVRLSSTTLRASVAQLLAPPPTPSPTWLRRRPHGSRVGLVHSVPFGVGHDPSSLASLVERIYLSTTHAKMYLAMNALAIDSCVMGKSNLWRKSDLRAVPDSFFAVGQDGNRDGDPEGALGSPAFQIDMAEASQGPPAAVAEFTEVGELDEVQTRLTLSQSRPLARFSIYLAEDNMVATSLWRAPLCLSHVLASSSPCIARTDVGDIRTLADYWARRSRWIRVRRYMVPEATALEPFTESLLSGLVGFVALRFFEYWPEGPLATAIFFLAHCAAWYTIDFAVLHALTSADDHDDDHEEEEEEVSMEDTGEGPERPAALGETQRLQSRPQSEPWTKGRSDSVFQRKGQRWEFTKAWMVREALALPIWCWAMWGGNEVNWRGQPYRILSDSRAARITHSSRSRSTPRGCTTFD